MPKGCNLRGKRAGLKVLTTGAIVVTASAKDKKIISDTRSSNRTFSAEYPLPKNQTAMLQDVALLIQGKPLILDRIDFLLRLYTQVFPMIYFLGWGDRPSGKRLRWEEAKIDKVTWCRRHMLWHSLCLPSMLRKMEEHPFVRGVLTFHFDFWIHPFQILRQARGSFDSIWELGHIPYKNMWVLNSGSQCFQNESALNNDTWQWHMESRQKGLDATRAVRKQWKIGSIVSVCRNWSDLFYLPRDAWSVYHDLAPFFSEVFHESAIPTILNIIVAYLGVSSRQILECWGGCCYNRAKKISIMRSYACGHGIDLQLNTSREALATVMREDHVQLARNFTSAQRPVCAPCT